MNSRSLASVALFGLVVRAVAVIAMHILRTDHDPLVSFVSEYGIGPYAWVAKTANLAGFCTIAAMLASLLSARLVAATSFVSIALGIHLAMRILTLLFPIDPIAEAVADGGMPDFSPAGWIHAIAGAVAAVTLMAAMVLVTLRYRKASRAGGVIWVLALLCVIAPISWVLTAVTPAATFPAGLYQRIFMVSTWLWLVLVCLALFQGRFAASRLATAQAAR